MPALLPSELPVLGVARHHWIVLFRRPGTVLIVALALLFVAAIVKPNPMALLFLLVLCAAGFLRYQTWRAERVILTRRRIIRVRGVPETTSSEASLRLDRISGARLEQTVLGKLLNYGTLELEAPGPHPDVRVLTKIARPHEFYVQVRRAVFGDGNDLDPDDSGSLDHPTDGGPANAITAPLPFFDPPPRRWLD
ncbi:MAG: hypothetical protein QOG80_2683 [Pseudonocardiales bacterium]|jgi:hypothetical protein|nr:hypothetical protein [Pseudonocardiales bacterium]